MLSNILLEPVQEELLISLVEASRNVPIERRQKFYVLQTTGGDFLTHPGMGKQNTKIYFGDVEILNREGLVSIGYGARGTQNFDITPRGFKYYEYLKTRSGEPIDQIESATTRYLETTKFREMFPDAYQKWVAAQELLWKTDSEQQLTTIGHLCREAVQEFADVLVKQYHPDGVTTDKSKTVARVKAVLQSPKLDFQSTEKPFVEALVSYWGTLNDLVQRQEHGALKEGRKLVWEDARRLVFQTAVTMFEIDRSISNAEKRARN